jgi:hypothetical protein
MLKSFITITELQTYYPSVDKLISAYVTAPGVQINAAVRRLTNDLRSLKNTVAGKVMIPANFSETLITITGNTTSDSKYVDRINQVLRIVVKKSSCSVGSVNEKIYLDGSQDGTIWDEGIAVVSLTAGAGELSSAYTLSYPYYRYRAVVATSINFTGYIYLIETTFDHLIIYKTLEILFGGLFKSVDDANDKMKNYWKSNYDDILATLKYAYDMDDSGTIESTELKRNNYDIRL